MASLILRGLILEGTAYWRGGSPLFWSFETDSHHIRWGLFRVVNRKRPILQLPLHCSCFGSRAERSCLTHETNSEKKKKTLSQISQFNPKDCNSHLKKYSEVAVLTLLLVKACDLSLTHVSKGMLFTCLESKWSWIRFVPRISSSTKNSWHTQFPAGIT